MSDTLCEIQISNIDLTDERYRINKEQVDIQALAGSIRKFGLALPPIVTPVDPNKKESGYIIVSGFNRIQALQVIQTQSVQMIKTGPKEGEKSCLKRAIALLSFQRQLTPFELICSFERLSDFYSSKEISDIAPALFNQKLNHRYIEKLIAIARLDYPVANLIRSGHLSLKTALKLLEFDLADIDIFTFIFKNIKASNSVQQEILLFLKEIAARQKTSIALSVEQMNINDILNDPDPDPVTKTRQLRACLQNSRFPVFTRTRQAVENNIQTLKFGNAIRFKPPENPDGLEYSIGFTAKNLSEFKKKVLLLEKRFDDDALKDLFTS